MNDKPNVNLPVSTGGVSNLLHEAQQSAGFEKRLTFKQGVYYCDGMEIPLGTKLTAQCVGWCKKWIKFVDKRHVDSKIYRIFNGERPVDRDMLDDRDKNSWAKDKNGVPQDPWVLQFLLPMTDPETDEVMIFSTSSKGGTRAVGDVITMYARRAQREPTCGQPVVRLSSTQMPTADFGKVLRPCFDVIGWDDGLKPVREVPDDVLKKNDFNDEIPF